MKFEHEKRFRHLYKKKRSTFGARLGPQSVTGNVESLLLLPNKGIKGMPTEKPLSERVE